MSVKAGRLICLHNHGDDPDAVYIGSVLLKEELGHGELHRVVQSAWSDFQPQRSRGAADSDFILFLCDIEPTLFETTRDGPYNLYLRP